MGKPALWPRPLGRTGLLVDPLCVGCASLGDMPETFAYSVAEEQALATIRAILDGPIHFLDTAASYGNGESERRLGVVLRERGGLPPGFVLSTKADRDLETGEFTGAQIRRSLERSLGLLGRESVQLCFLHDPEHIGFEAALAPGGPVDALLQARDEGLIEHVGVAGGPVDLMTRLVRTGLFEAAITHNRYTLLNTAAESLLDVCRQEGVALLNAAPYASGILAKGVAAYPRYVYRQAPTDIVERVRGLEAIVARWQVPLAAAALQFSLRDPRLVSTVVGVTRPERLAETIALASLPIPEGCWAELRSVAPTREDPEAAARA